MADLLGKASELTGIGGGGGGGIGNVITIFAVVIIFGLIAIGATYLIVIRLQFKHRIVIFERVDGIPKVTRRDRARTMKIGKAGDEAFYLKKHKKIIPSPSIQTGNNIYWFWISDDGEWMNFGPGNFDEDRRELGAHFLDKEVRHTRTALQHSIEDRYSQPGFWEKYGGIVAYTVLILVTAIGFWLIIDKLIEVSNATSGAVDAAKGVLEETKRVLSGLDTITSGGSGYVQS